jgi:tetratricopeptide (TPR) repeat protein
MLDASLSSTDNDATSTLLHDRIVTPAQARRIASPAGGEPPRLRELEIVLSGRNDSYGGEDFHERMLIVAAFNHARLTEARVPHRFTLVEWNPPEGRVPLIDRLREQLPWWHRSWVVSRAWHTWYQENPRLQFMEFFAKNAGIRRATGDWVLTTNSDVFLGREIVQRLAEGRLQPGTLYRASRLDLERTMPREDVTWNRLEAPQYLLRRFDPEPPYFNEAAGDFLLLDRDSYHRVGGFNERIRFSKIHKDGQFCVQAHHHGLAIESLGPVYHIDHDGSFINTKHIYQPGFADAPFGPDWPCWQAHWNREDWGVRPAIEERRGDTIWLRTPEEVGPVLSLVLHGRGDVAARAAALGGLLKTPAPIEVLIVDPEPALAEALPGPGDDRLRAILAPDVEPGTPTAAALRIAASFAHGRHLVYLPGPVAIDGLDHLIARLEPASAAEVAGPIVHAVDAEPGAAGRAVTVVSRRALDRIDGIDAFAADPVGEFAARARRAFGATPVEDVVVRALPSVDGAVADTVVDTAWASLGSGGVVPASVAADLTRRGELLTAHVRVRLARELPDDARDVAVFGVSPITPFAMAALRALGRRVVGVFAPSGDGSLEVAGMPVRPPSDLGGYGSLWVVASCASPADVTVLYERVPFERAIHVVEPASVRPSSPPFATAPSFEGLAYARECREAGAFREAEAAYRALLRDPNCADAVRARYELALVQEQLGNLREAEAGLRWAFRHWPEQRSTMAYNLGSLYERQARWGLASRAFTRALRHAAADDSARRGGCHFHLGEIALAMGDDTSARAHFVSALDALPNHGKARARLEALVTA